MKSGPTLVFVQVTKRLVLFKINKQLKTEELWDLSAEILTELSKRDGVDYRIKATPESVDEKIDSLEIDSLLDSLE